MDTGAKRTLKNKEEAGWEKQSKGGIRGHMTRVVTRALCWELNAPWSPF